ncbi:serine/threonine-protein kinase [Celeribacter halophilus]|uniref:serine/threonine-protein kinase n=1 Tax=Celeribacter halophilus TaxID=576117 RepID=UPI003A90397D
MSDEDKAILPTGEEPQSQHEAQEAAEAEDRTVLAFPDDLLSAQEAASAKEEPLNEDQIDEDEATILSPQCAPPVSSTDPHGDETILSPLSFASTPSESTSGDDPEATILAGTPAQSLAVPQATAEQRSDTPTPPDDPDATVLAGVGVAAPAGASSSEVPRPLDALKPGTVINNMYRVESPLDQGGMGRVFRGEEIGTGEPVAIKVILPEMAEDLKVGQMFKREARTLRQLHHPAIVRYFAYVPPDERMNLHALVMGFIEGTKLSDHLRDKGALSTDEACRLFSRLADGLRRAHEIGVIHRDLSPDNVMLQDGDITRGVLIDFGISRSSKVKDVTIGNEFAGKLKYVSPEQLGAFGGESDGRSDVYSMGLLLIAALTGKAPQMGDTIVDAVQKRQTIPDLSGLPGPFQPLLYAMLQPDPAQRMPDMQSVISGLDMISGGQTGAGGTLTGIGGTGVGTAVSGGAGFSAAPTTHAVPGLQSGPTAAVLGLQRPSVDLAESVEVKDEPEPKSRSGMVLALSFALLASALGGGAYYWWRSHPIELASLTEDGGLMRDESTVAGVLAAAAEGACAYASDTGTGRIAALSDSGTAFADLAVNWPFGTAPEVDETVIAAPQCAALTLAQPFLGSRREPISIRLDAAQVTRQTGIVGTIHGTEGRQIWLSIVAPNGRVFSLSRQLEAPIGNARRFSFRLPSAQPGVYVIVATASEAASVRAGVMQDATEAGVILPLIGREIAEDAQGYVTIGALTITP